jgi:CRISPR/Cas system-associated endonuclease Cas1
LVYDIIEPFRYLVDKSVFEIQDKIRKKDYAFSREGIIVVLSDELKRKYIDLLSVFLIESEITRQGQELEELMAIKEWRR